MTTKLSALPLPLASQLLINRLTPELAHSVFRSNKTPSLQRRARLLPPPAHFSFVNPFPVAFPYDIDGEYIESWLAAREAVHPRRDKVTSLLAHDPRLRDTPRVLLAVAESALRDCLPHLDVGDAFSVLGPPSLSDQSPYTAPTSTPEATSARNELVDILSGHSVLKSHDDAPPFAPWSLRYSGHQFGTWAGQLGDGRAISILATPHPTNPSETIELQLKGAGRTPFSRTADGLAVLRSSIREYLCSEAMHALRIPTTRALALVSLPSLPVHRERTETACVLTRLAPSFIRIGNFEAMNGPASMSFFGGGQQDPDWDGLRILGEWVASDVLKLALKEGEPWGSELVFDVARRNARMVAAWQAYGFMHGVINTDNVSILGLTIDYGPYAFMDVFDPFHICNHSDDSGRYAYRYQPNMIIYALRALLTSLAPLIGYELTTSHSAPSGWSTSLPPSTTLSTLRTLGLTLLPSLEATIQRETALAYARHMRARLGLRYADPSGEDETRVWGPLLRVLEAQGCDFHAVFRVLCGFRVGREGEGREEVVRALVGMGMGMAGRGGESQSQSEVGLQRRKEEWEGWLDVYATRLRRDEEVALWDGDEREREREREMRRVNPRFVLRQWVLEEVIARVERDVEGGRRVLGKVLKMATNPFDAWGAEGDTRPEDELGEEEREERRLCGVGEKRMLGFQCSCSS